MKPKTKAFPARVLLTITTGRLLTGGKGDRANGIGDLYDILGWMTEDSPFTHQLGRFAKECEPWLLKRFPELTKAGSVKNVARLDELGENAKARGESFEDALQLWLKWMAEPGTAGIKESYDVPRIPKEDHASKNPLEELVEMRGGKTDGIVVLETA